MGAQVPKAWREQLRARGVRSGRSIEHSRVVRTYPLDILGVKNHHNSIQVWDVTVQEAVLIIHNVRQNDQ